jgi:hypothetical protein
MQGAETLAKDTDSFGGDAVRLPTFFWRQWLDQLLLLKPSDSPVEGPRTEPGAAEKNNILDHCVTVLGTTRQTREDEQRRIGIL